MSSPGGVTKLSKTPNVIVVPIQISKEMIAAKHGEKAAAIGTASASAKSKESPEKASSAKASPEKASLKAAGASKKGSDASDSDKETPKTGTKAKKAAATPKSESVEPKPEQSSPEPTRRSKRESKMSSKLAEWGLLPSAGKKFSLPFSKFYLTVGLEIQIMLTTLTRLFCCLRLSALKLDINTSP